MYFKVYAAWTTITPTNDKDIDKSVKTTEPMRYIGTEGLTNDKVWHEL